MISIRSSDGGEFQAYLAVPASGRGPGLVVLQEIFGVNANMRSVCDWFAARGFVALCPDLFWRIEPNVELVPERDRERALELYRKLDMGKAVEDAAAAMDALRGHAACTGRVGTAGYCLGGRLAYELAVRYAPDAAVAYYGVGIEQSIGEPRCPLLLHVAGRDKYSPAAVQERLKAAHPDAVRIYPEADHAFARRGGAHYDPAAAELADLRTVEFLLRTLMLKPYSLEAIWGDHIKYEFATRSTEDTLATMVDDAYVNHIPVLTGGVGKAELREFYSKHFIPQMPPDTALTPISRTVGEDQIVDEMIFEFTHTIKMDWMLPGIEPTGKHVKVPLVAIVRLRGDKLAHEHIYWDQASVLVQLGLLDQSSLPVAGAESARKAVNPKSPSRVLGD